jgi:hypothetical protein
MLTIDQIKKGDTFYECESGFNDEYVALCNPCRRDDGWAIYGRHVEDQCRVRFFQHDQYSGYVKLYSYPAYE